MSHGTEAKGESEALNSSRRELSEQLYYGMSWSGSERNCLFLNHGGDSFATASYITGFDFADDGRGIAMVDWDHDGDLDVWLSNRHGPQVRFLQNKLTDSRWLSLKLMGDGKKVNRDAVGSTVIVWVEEGGKEVPLKRSVAVGDTFLSQSSLWINVGLAEAVIKKIEVRWPDGSRQELPALKENQQYTLKYGESEAVGWSRPSPVKLAEKELDEPVLGNKGIRLVRGTALPPLHLVDENKNPVGIEAGKAKLIKFWASWCPNCQKELKQLPRYKSYFQQVGVDVVLVNAEMRPDGKLKMAKSPIAGFPNYYMGKRGGENLQRYLDSITVLHQEMKLPMGMLINDKGDVSAVYLGSVKAESIARTALVARKPEAWRYVDAIPFQGQMFNNTIIGNADKVADNFQSVGEFKYAAKVYQKALTQFEKNAQFHFRYGECLLKLQKYDEAVLLLEKSLSLGSEGVLKRDVLRALGVAYTQAGQLAKAGQVLVQALEFGDDYKTYFYTGVLADRNEQYAKAEESYLKAIALSKGQKPVFHEPWHALSRLYLEQGRSLERQHLIDQGDELGLKW